MNIRRWVVLLVGFAIVAAIPGTFAGAEPVTRRLDRGVSLRSAAYRPVPGVTIRSFDPPEQPWLSGHRGVDLEAEPGDIVRTTLPGTVSYSGVIAGVGWVAVDHGGGMHTTYGPLAARIETSTTVKGGDVIGVLAVDAEHLDWGARLHESYIDPETLLVRWEAHLAPLRES